MKRLTRLALLALVLALGALALTWFRRGAARDPIRVGVLHSLTGTMAISERAVVDATLMAIEELNPAGGVLGRPVEAVVRDGASNGSTFASEAERLIRQDRVAATFGCWTSASRKTVKPIVERHGTCSSIRCSTRGWSSRRTSSTPARRRTSRSSRP